MIDSPYADARAARIAAKPYARPETKLTKSASMLSLPGLGIRSIVSYITAPFARSPPSKGLPFTQADIAVEQKSESGSEDEWNGQPSEQMHGKDVFDLAQAAGRDGADFDSRADQWRARGEKAGGRRETSRKALFASPSKPTPKALKSPQASANPTPSSRSKVTRTHDPKPRNQFQWHDEPETPTINPPQSETMPGHLGSDLPTSSSMPSFGTPLREHNSTFGNSTISSAISSVINPLKRRFSPTKTPRTIASGSILPERALEHAPIDFDTPVATAPVEPVGPVSASSAALQAFLVAKNGQQLDADDLRVIESLTRNAHHEVEASTIQRQATPGQKTIPFATPGASSSGWAAASYTPRAIKPLPNTTASPATPFFYANTTPASRTAATSYSKTPIIYRGPGYSTRRSDKKRPGLKPLYASSSLEKDDDDDESSSKRRRTTANVDRVPLSPVPVHAFGSGASASHLGVSIPERQTPKREFLSPTNAQIIGKRRSQAIVQDLFEEINADENDKTTPFVVNPYHPDAHTVVASFARPGAEVTSSIPTASQRKSTLKASTNTPFLSSSSSSPAKASSVHSVSRAAPTASDGRHTDFFEERARGKDDDLAQPRRTRETSVNELVQRDRQMSSGESRSQTQAVTAAAPVKGLTESKRQPKRAEIEEPEPVTPFTAPQLSSGVLPSPNSANAFKSAEHSRSSDTFVFGASNAAPPASTFNFSPSVKLKQQPQPDPPTAPGPRGQGPFTLSTAPSTNSNLFHSARELAAAMPVESLPFFTFTLTSSLRAQTQALAAAQIEAAKRTALSFDFVLAADGASKRVKFA